jgi:predicted transcriptional regulator
MAAKKKPAKWETKMVGVRLPADQCRKLEELCAMDERNTQAYIIARALDAYYEAQQKIVSGRQRVLAGAGAS